MKDNRQIRIIIDDLISKKLSIDENCFTFTYFEVMVKNNLKKEQENEFCELAKIKLNNMGYRVYFESEQFEYNNAYRRVQSNELLIAVKGNL